jgi:1-acyl-sn-glycerol-3-phosphate acyltransferase
MWFCAYAAKVHGHIFIILKQSLKFLPLIGPGMMLFSFIFLSRNWATDKPRFQHRLRKLKKTHRAPSPDAEAQLDPMWLLLFPEGTTLCQNGRRASAAWARKQGIEDLTHTLLPRSRGMLYCLEELAGTIDWVYDCTLSYEGIPYVLFGN